MFRQCKNPKGTMDYVGKTNRNLDWLIKTLTELFKTYEPEFIRTPVFELKDVLLQKYGEEAESKLLYHIEDCQNNIERDEGETESEKLTLRYDHTIPLVRYLVQHKIKKGKFARIGEVFRRDTPSKKQVRLRSFWQADFDFVGESSQMEYEIYIFSMINDCFEKINSLFAPYSRGTEYEIIYNFRKNLFKIFELAGVEVANYNTIASSIDKLDKQSWETISLEMYQKGLTEEQVKKLKELIDQKYLDPSLKNEFDTLTKLNSIANPNQKIRFEPSLARGLDYYNGIIFEVIVKGIIGSVCAGGRYDGLIESYKDNTNSMSSNDAESIGLIGLIGVSFGLNRLLPILDPNEDESQPDFNEIKKMKIYIACIGDYLLESKIKLYRYLTNCDDYDVNYFIETDSINGRGEMVKIKFEEKYYIETTFGKKKLAREINKCVEEGFSIMIIISDSENANDEYQIKFIKDSTTYFIKQKYLTYFLSKYLENYLNSPLYSNLTKKGYLREKTIE
jgi:histidyl-tRNA synthetase